MSWSHPDIGCLIVPRESGALLSSISLNVGHEGVPSSLESVVFEFRFSGFSFHLVPPFVPCSDLLVGDRVGYPYSPRHTVVSGRVGNPDIPSVC